MTAESQLLKDIITALYDKYKDEALVVRLNSGAFRQGKRWIRSTSITGMPDILVILRGGQYIGLEVKTAKGKLNENQLKFQASCFEREIPYYVVRSVEEAESILSAVQDQTNLTTTSNPQQC